MLSSFNITFLGTASAQPSSTRNHSSLAMRLGSEIWLFDCGESTQKQIQASKGIRMGRIRKIFITHTHGKLNIYRSYKKLTWRSGDHIFGLLPLMASCLNGAGGTVDGVEDPRLSIDDKDDTEVGLFARQHVSNLRQSILSSATRDIWTFGHACICSGRAQVDTYASWRQVRCPRATSST